MIIRDACNLIIADSLPIRVSDNGKALGVVSSDDVLRIISGVA